MGSRTRAREQALQILYMMDFNNFTTQSALELFRSHFETHEEEFGFIGKIVSGVTSNLKTIDENIEKHSDHWRLSRMPKIDLNILRIGTYELLHIPETPPSAVLNEAIELGKKFGESKSPAFINGILDQIFKQIRKAL